MQPEPIISIREEARRFRVPSGGAGVQVEGAELRLECANQLPGRLPVVWRPARSGPRRDILTEAQLSGSIDRPTAGIVDGAAALAHLHHHPPSSGPAWLRSPAPAHSPSSRSSAVSARTPPLS